MLIYQCVVLGILVALLLNTLSNLRLLRRPAVQPPPATGPLVSILIPARNGARAIARCVISLARQEHPHCEILVLDDQSDDDTAAIVERLAAALALVGWTCALLERSLGRAPMSQSALRLPATRDVPRTQAAGGAWRALIADAAVGVGSAVYLELSGLLPIWLLLAALVVLAMSPQLMPWRAVPAAASVLFGGLLVLAAGSHMPEIDVVLAVWTALIVLFARRPIAQVVHLWRQRARSQ